MSKGNIEITQNITHDVVADLTKTYSYLQHCNDALSNCSVLEELGINNEERSTIKTNLETCFKNIEQISRETAHLENSTMEFDDVSASKLSIPSTPPSGNGNTTNNNSNNTSGGIASASLKIPVIAFSTDKEIASSNGDIFINDGEYSLTEFTNNILLQYKINNEETANKIYEDVLNYGKNYYQQYGTNPLKVLSPQQVWSDISSVYPWAVPTDVENNKVIKGEL